MALGDVSPLKVIQALAGAGWHEVPNEADEPSLVVLDTDIWQNTIPIVIDTSQALVPFEADILPQLDQAGVDLNAFMAAWESIEG